MELRTFYSAVSALIVAMGFSSCSTHMHMDSPTHTHASRTTDPKGMGYDGAIRPAMDSATSIPSVAASTSLPPSTAVSTTTSAFTPVSSSVFQRLPFVSSVAAENARAEAIRDSAPRNFVVRTTAYSHQERDSWKYGKSSAAGGTLKYGKEERSAAADWSRFPVGTRFRIAGLAQEYVVEDYGRALVGSDTIDIYKPTLSSMKQWGTRHVGIEVLEWGSFNESERILKSRAHKAPHVRQMLEIIQQKIIKIPAQLRDGFSV